MDHPLLGVLSKLNRASEHLTPLSEDIQGFLEEDFYAVSPEFDREGRIVARCAWVKETPLEWGVVIGEIVYNLRSALDHLAYELAVLNTTGRLPKAIAESSAWPILTSGPKYRKLQTKGGKRGQPTNDSGLHKIRGTSRAAHAVIERLQPYHRWKYPDTRRLLELERLSNVDKHRTLHLTAAQLAGSRYTISGFGWKRILKVETFARPLKAKAMLARFTVEWDPAVSHHHVDVKANAISNVTFGRGPTERVLRDLPVAASLEAIRDFIMDDVIPAVAELPELRHVKIEEVPQ